MKLSQYLGFLIIVLTLFINVRPQIVCPDFEVRENTNDPFIRQRWERELTKEIWKSPLLSRPTPLAAQMRDIIVDMSESDSFEASEFAFQFSGWSACFLAEAKSIYPNFCPFARVINITAEGVKTQDTSKFAEALNETLKTVPYAFNALQHAALTELDCPNNTDIVSGFKNCWENGLSSSQDDVWDVFGRRLSWPLRYTMKLMAKSDLFTDRAYSVMLAFVLTPAQIFYFTNQYYDRMFESARYYTNAANNSKCCCDHWKRRMESLTLNHTETARVNAEKKINELIGCPVSTARNGSSITPSISLSTSNRTITTEGFNNTSSATTPPPTEEEYE